MRFGWKVLIPASLVWILVIATIRVWRTHGGSPAVYTVAGLLLVALLALLFMADTAMQRRQEAAAGIAAADEAEAGSALAPADDSVAFPVPPLDLPHYHGIGVTVSTEHGTSESADGTTKEVTGA
jgi:NADH-quinone oxidoreductase subunit H